MNSSNIQRRIRRYERLARKYTPRSARSFDLYGFELAVAKHMKDLAEGDGLSFGDIDSRRLDALDLEHLLGKVSRIAVRRNLFDDYATLLDFSFTKPQQRFLFYMMSDIVRAYQRKHRCFIARNTLPYDWPDSRPRPDS